MNARPDARLDHLRRGVREALKCPGEAGIARKSNKCYLYNFLYNKKEQRMLSLLKEKGGQDRPSLVHC